MTASSSRFAIAAAPALAAFSVSCPVVTGGTPAVARHGAGTASAASAPTMGYLKKGRVQNGFTTIKISTVTVTGDTATATMEVHNDALGAGELTLRTAGRSAIHHE